MGKLHFVRFALPTVDKVIRQDCKDEPKLLRYDWGNFNISVKLKYAKAFLCKIKKVNLLSNSNKNPFLSFERISNIQPNWLSFKQSFTIQTKAALSLPSGGQRGWPPSLSLNKTKFQKIGSVSDIGEIILLNGPMVRTVL